MLKICFIMRGVSGSGKSTAAKAIAASPILGTECDFWMYDEGKGADRRVVTYYGNKDAGLIQSAIHSTDSYFLNEEGVYVFNQSMIGMHHTKNFKAFRTSCENDIPIVICDNTNLVRKEWKRYAACADNRGYFVAFVELPLPKPEDAAKRNAHSVPQASIEKMIRKWQPFNGNIHGK